MNIEQRKIKNFNIGDTTNLGIIYDCVYRGYGGWFYQIEGSKQWYQSECLTPTP